MTFLVIVTLSALQVIVCLVLLGATRVGPSGPLPLYQSINTFITRHVTEARATVRIMPKQREMS